MNRIFIILVIAITLVDCSKTPKDCSNFKTGNFKYQDTNLSNWIVIRNDSLQIEVDNAINKETIAIVKWVSDCQYNLTYKKVIDSSMNSLLGTTITVDILSTSEKSYTFEAYNKEFSFKNRMILIE